MEYTSVRSLFSLVVFLLSLSFVYQLIGQLTKTQEIDAINLFGLPVVLAILIIDFIFYFFSTKNTRYNYWISSAGILLMAIYFIVAYV